MLNNPATPSRTTSALPAIALVLCAVAFFSSADSLAKLLRGSLPSIEIAWLRYIVFAALGCALAVPGGLVWPARIGSQLGRGLVLIGSTLFFIIALGYLPVAEATAINFIYPAFITILSMPLLGETVGVRRWGAIALGFAGVLVAMRPGAAAFQPAAVFPLLAAMCWATSVLLTRRMSSTERSETTLFWSAGTGLVLLTCLLPFGFVVPTWQQLAIALAMGICGSLGQYMMIIAFRAAPASVLAPFTYAQVLTATLAGFVVFGAIPDHATIEGAALIVSSGLYSAHRERVRMAGPLARTKA